MIKLSQRYPGRTEEPSEGYPYGSPRNATAPGSGTPWHPGWANDLSNGIGAILQYGRQPPTGSIGPALEQIVEDTARSYGNASLFSLHAAFSAGVAGFVSEQRVCGISDDLSTLFVITSRSVRALHLHSPGRIVDGHTVGQSLTIEGADVRSATFGEGGKELDVRTPDAVLTYRLAAPWNLEGAEPVSPDDGDELQRLARSPGWAFDEVAWSRDRRTVFTASRNGAIKLANRNAQLELPAAGLLPIAFDGGTQRAMKSISGLAVHPDGRTLSLAVDFSEDADISARHELLEVRLEAEPTLTAQIIARPPDFPITKIVGLCWHPDGTRLFLGRPGGVEQLDLWRIHR